MSGKKGRSGRRKSTATLVMEALQENDNYLSEYLETLRKIAFDDKATARERIECLIYLTNRSQGSPKAKTDMRVKSTIDFTPDDYLNLLPLLEKDEGERKLLEPQSDTPLLTEQTE